MRHLAIALICVIVAASTLSIAAEPVATGASSELKSRIARLSVDTGQALGAYLTVIAPRQRPWSVVSPGSKDHPIPELTRLFQNLYMSARLTKDLSEVVCTDSEVKKVCGQKFDPAWLSDPNSMKPTIESLTAWTGETETAIDPLRRGLCKLAGIKTGNANICPRPVKISPSSF